MPRSLIRYIVTVMALAALVRAACAQRPAPVGMWYNRAGSVMLYVGDTGTCVYASHITPRVVGTWTWRNTTSTGGILQLNYHSAGFLNHLYFGINWLDRRRILWSAGGPGEILYRRF